MAQRHVYFVFLSLLFSVVTACSSSKRGADTSANEGATLESSADAIGSIPEDMLATEEQLPMGEAAADPFADLKEPEDAGSATSPDLATAETEGSTESSSSVASSAALGGEPGVYVVKAGDTLMKIAFTIYGDIDRWRDLRDWNKGDAEKALRVGTRLRYEAPVEAFAPDQLPHSYMIKKGDTLAGIADEVYGRKMKFRKLQKYNARLIKNPNRIFAGFTLFYDITAQEMAEAEARRKERELAGGGFSNTPSAISPAETGSVAPAPLAGSGSDLMGPPSPRAQ
jgi:nucleoid-associated protein YgaU